MSFLPLEPLIQRLEFPGEAAVEVASHRPPSSARAIHPENRRAAVAAAHRPQREWLPTRPRVLRTREVQAIWQLEAVYFQAVVIPSAIVAVI